MRTQKDLENLIKKYAQSYYSGISEVSDEYFDELVEELKTFYPESEVLNKTGWGFEPDGEKKSSHLYGMTVLGLRKVKSIESIPSGFFPYNTRFSAKLDGLSVVSYYKNGERYLSLTRGNGKVGKIVTDKIDIISPETKKISQDFTGAVRGEVLFSSKNWNLVKEKYLIDNPSANPRNIASGILNRDYINEETELLSYVVYKIVAQESEIKDQGRFFSDMEAFLIYNNFTFVPSFIRDDEDHFDLQRLKSLYDTFCDTYPCDGIVLTRRDNVRYSSSGEVTYDEVAYKFESESAEVVVTDVDWNATRTGRVVPRIWFDPVNLSGAMIKKCTGHNAAFIRDNKINKGTVIEITRSNEVIPYMKKVISNKNSEGLIPETCPNCGAELRWKGEDLVCDNENESQLIYRFISVVGETDGAGWSLYSKFIDLFNLNSYEDLIKFLLRVVNDKESLTNTVCESIKGSSTQNKCLNIINKISSEVDPVTVLVACNISGISWTTSGKLVDEYPSYFEDLLLNKVNYDTIWSIKGVGGSVVKTLQFFEARIRGIASKLRIKDHAKESSELNFYVAITGALSVKRSEFDRILSEKGIQQSSNFKEVKYLITNNPDSTSSKMKKAKDHGVEIISEEDFTNLYLQ